MRKVRTYQNDYSNFVDSSCLVSGNAQSVKMILTKQFVKKSLNAGRTVLYLDFSNGNKYLTESDFSGLEIKKLHIDYMSYDPFYNCDAKAALKLILQKDSPLSVPTTQPLAVS